MKKILSIAIVAIFVAGSTAVYAGSCGCSGQKAEKAETAETSV